VSATEGAHDRLVFSFFESKRFGLRIFRGTTQGADADSLIRELERERVDVAILRGAAAEALRAGLSERGLRVIDAGTIVRYAADLRSRVRTSPDPRLGFRRATADGTGRLDTMARQVFAGYTTHYHANPLFTPSRILEGYAEWATRYADPNDPCRSAWIIEYEGQAAGFSCLETAADRSEARGVLNGILPAWRGRGIYRAMLRATLDALAAEGIPRFVIATQTQNLPVQHVWRTERMVFERSESTIHVNALLGSATPPAAG
jgi:hypothetical protein